MCSVTSVVTLVKGVEVLITDEARIGKELRASVHCCFYGLFRILTAMLPVHMLLLMHTAPTKSVCGMVSMYACHWMLCKSCSCL
jgi:hypothetical protein